MSETEQSGGILAVIERAAINPDIDVTKMMALLDMQERIMAKNAESAFNDAMTRLQEAMPRITKDGNIEFVDNKNNHRKTPFATYENIDKAIRPLMIAEGFSIAFNSEWGESGATIHATLSHRDGHSRKASIRLPLDSSGSKNSLQAMGSTISYGKRYLVTMMLNIVTEGEDNDGDDAHQFIDTEQAATLDTMILETKANRASFLKYIGAESVQKILASDYQKALNALKAKEKQNANPQR